MTFYRRHLVHSHVEKYLNLKYQNQFSERLEKGRKKLVILMTTILIQVKSALMGRAIQMESLTQ